MSVTSTERLFGSALRARGDAGLTRWLWFWCGCVAYDYGDYVSASPCQRHMDALAALPNVGSHLLEA